MIYLTFLIGLPALWLCASALRRTAYRSAVRKRLDTHCTRKGTS